MLSLVLLIVGVGIPQYVSASVADFPNIVSAGIADSLNRLRDRAGTMLLESSFLDALPLPDASYLSTTVETGVRRLFLRTNAFFQSSFGIPFHRLRLISLFNRAPAVPLNPLSLTDITELKQEIASVKDELAAYEGRPRQLVPAEIVRDGSLDHLASRIAALEAKFGIVPSRAPASVLPGDLAPLHSSLALLDQKFATLSANVASQVASAATRFSAGGPSQIFATAPQAGLANRIDQLTRVTLIDPIVSGNITGIKAKDIPQDIIAANYLPLSGGSLSGALTVSGISAFSSFAATSTSATSTIATGGLAIGTDQFVVQQTSGRVGIGTTSPSAKLAIISTPAIITGLNLISNGTFTGSANGWTLGNNVTWGTDKVTSAYAGGNPAISTTFQTVSGKSYRLIFTVSAANAPMYFYFNSNTLDFNDGPFRNGTVTVVFKTNFTGTETIWFDDYNYVSGDTWTLDDVSITEVSVDDGLLRVDGYDGATLFSLGGFSVTNTALGWSALKTNTGRYNTAIGYAALTANTTGGYNTAIGNNTLSSNTTGSYNTAIGPLALFNHTTGSSNIGIGFEALFTTTSGAGNIAINSFALMKNTTGIDNIGIGYESLKQNTTGSENTALGFRALEKNISGSENVALSNTALRSNTSGLYNIAIGGAALTENTTGSKNIAIGRTALSLATTGDNNIALGVQAGESLTTGSNNIIIGYNIDSPFPTSANTLNIGNLIFGTGIDGVNTNLSSGNLGIGTTTPLAKLSVYGSATIQTPVNTLTAFRIFTSATFSVFTVDTVNSSTTVVNILNTGTITATSGTSYLNGLNLGSALTVSNGGTGQTSFTAGNLLYGSAANGIQNVATSSVTCSSGISCASFTIVGGGGSVITNSKNPDLAYLTIGGTKYYTASSTATDNLSWYFANGFSSTASSSVSGQFSFANASGTQLTTTGSTYLATAGGNVGIGTTSPSYKLQIDSGDILLDNGYALRGKDTAGNPKMLIATSGDNTRINSETADTIFTSGGAAEKVRIKFNGNVGIGTTSPMDKLSVVGNIAVTGCVRNAANGTLLTGSPACVDIAESYIAGENLLPGEIVAVKSDAATPEGFSVIEATSSSAVLGVISTRPAVFLEGETAFFGGSHFSASSTFPLGSEVPVALAGRVPVKVSTEAGPIQIGDRITSSSLPGIGMKATSSGMTIGIALENFDGLKTENGVTSRAATTKILVFVNLGYAKLDSAVATAGAAGTNFATNGWSVDQVSSKVSVRFYGGVNMQGNNILDVGRIAGMFGKWSIDADGNLVAQKITTEELEVGSQNKPSGITIYDRVTGAAYCAFIANGVMQIEPGVCGTSVPAISQQSATSSGQATTSAVSATTATATNNIMSTTAIVTDTAAAVATSTTNANAVVRTTFDVASSTTP